MNDEELTSIPYPNIVSDIAALTRQAVTPFRIDDTPAIVIPKDMALQIFDERRDAPKRTKATVTLHTAESFIAYWQRFRKAESVVFFDEPNATFRGILDYHDADQPGWLEHRALYTCPQTPEWKTWQAHSGKQCTQLDFAYFVEQNIGDIRDPSGAAMLEIVTTLKAQTNVSFNKAIRLQSGHNELTYNEVIDGAAGKAGQLRIPEEITLGIAPYKRSQAYAIPAKFRYRIGEGGKLTMWYDLLRPYKVNETALQDIVKQVADGIGERLMLAGTL